ncbi:MAG TPA: IclR family transcriptional regulator C-terminal domain-containing protein [Bordetella sp.]|nr:IclR family transcriptional regulator C-terminal domain-containing protein [Bordetella sp.]
MENRTRKQPGVAAAKATASGASTRRTSAAKTTKAANGVAALAETIPSRSAAKADSDLPGASSTLFVNSVEKAMRVLTAFDDKHSRLSLSQIASLTDLDLSAAQRFTFTLVTLRYLVKDPFTKTYSLSPRLLDFAFHYLASNELVRRAAPYLRQLSQETEETANITVLEDTDIVFTLRIVSQHVLNPHVITGSRLPAYCTAPGLAILSRLPEDQVRGILDGSNLIEHTPHTVADRPGIMKRLEAFRKQGYSHTKGEYYIGDISTAAPIVDARGYPIAAVNVAVSRARWRGAKDEQRISNLVIAAAGAISGQF